jgi:DNA-binding protein HU-beta
MNKTEMITKLAKKAGLTQAKAGEAIDALFNASKGLIAVELAAGRRVTLPGFGGFTVRKRGPRQGRNPATGAAIKIPGRSYPAFKVGKTLKEKVGK